MKKLLFLLLLSFLMYACDDDDNPETPMGDLKLNITGLMDLGNDYAYEGWLIVAGKAVSAGVFTVDEAGKLSKNSFNIESSKLEKATKYVLTIEPKPDNDPNPSKVHILAGDFKGKSASLSVGHNDALRNDFSTAVGQYILATPTNDESNDEKSGVWWLDPMEKPAKPGLSLPDLPAGWKYEGWVVIDGKPITTGKFTTVIGRDESAPYSGSKLGPAFPGEDFLMNAPSGFTFPTNLEGEKVVISIEPEPDNSLDPFLLKPLVGDVPNNTAENTVFNMVNNSSATNPTGTASR